MYREIKNCRLCGESDLRIVLDLGMQAFTGIFSKDARDPVPVGPLQLVKCRECDLVQLAHSFNSALLYGKSYGYRSGLNKSMVRHLNDTVSKLVAKYTPAAGDLILDIGSNDSTLLQGYPEGKFNLIGIDPTGVKFKNYYPEAIQLIPDFFSAHLFRSKVGTQKAKIITSIAMFYDLEDPVGFCHEIAEILADDGVWFFEQSYLPAMLTQTSYDTICHEHLEYYGLKQIKRMTDEAGLKILDVQFNDANGGSFAITAAKTDAPYPEAEAVIQAILANEERLGLSTMVPYQNFAQRIDEHRDHLVKFVARLRSEGKRVFGYGASTKGNVLLQYCNFTREDIPCIADVNEDKFGAYTPGTHIPIVSEEEASRLSPDYYLVLPWHFRKNILEREKAFLNSGGRFLFPLPEVEIISG